MAVEVIGSEIPLTVPSVFFYGFDHCVNTLLCTISLLLFTHLMAELYILLTAEYEQTGNHKRLSLRSFTVVLCRLETFIGIPREAVEV